MMQCPQCGQFAHKLTSPYNGPYKTCKSCNDKHLYEENRRLREVKYEYVDNEDSR